MTLEDVRPLHNHWKRHPPLRILVSMCAAALGVKLPETTSTTLPPHPMSVHPLASAETAKKYPTFEDHMRTLSMTGGKIEGIGG